MQEQKPKNVSTLPERATGKNDNMFTDEVVVCDYLSRISGCSFNELFSK